MSSEQFQAAHDSIYSTGTRVLQYLQEIRKDREREGDNTKGLQSVEDDITKALNALKEQTYQVAVIAAMKAGKSTFLNALIGADVVASEAKSCTVCRTDILPIDAGQVPRLWEYQQEQKQTEPIAQGDAGVIKQKFLERTHEIRHTNNRDKTTRFELEYPIEAISQFSSLAGFTLVDTPGPDEWESVNFDTVALKQTALEALRTCDAILFILDYTKFANNTTASLLKGLIEGRSEFLAQNTGKIYFILNKVDQKAADDQPIEDVMADLRQALISFGIPEPIIYKASAWQGLLAKLIQQGTATDAHLENFKTFFSGRYARYNESGDLVTPAPWKVAPPALEDSYIPMIEQAVLQTVVQNSGWNLLSDVLAKIDKAAQAIEDTLNTRIGGWEMEIETLKGKVEEYKRRADSAKRKVAAVKKTVEKQKQILPEGFSKGISIFAEGAKAKIQDEIERVAESRSSETIKSENKDNYELSPQPSGDFLGEIVEGIGEIGATLSEVVLGRLGRGLGAVIKGATSLVSNLIQTNPEHFNTHAYEESKTHEPYKIRCKTMDEAQNIAIAINEYCAPHIENWWIDTQDELVRGGIRVREKLVQTIQKDIQQISNELSEYLGNALEVKLNINPIEFPSFEFRGIDAQIQEQQNRIKVIERGMCNSEKVYYIPRSTYEIDLHQAAEAIKQKIDEQVLRSSQLLQLVIKGQVKEDFKSAEQQITDYINRFQTEFDRLLRERETRGAEAAQILAILEFQKAQVNEYLSELSSIRASLDSWKPVQTGSSRLQITPLHSALVASMPSNQ